MTAGTATLLTVGLVGAFGLGVAVGPSITQRNMNAPDLDPVAATTPAPAPVEARPAPRARPVADRAEDRAREERVVIAASTPEVHERLKNVLNRGTKMDVAAEGFVDAEQFATVAHASRNTEVPFMVLKHRILNEKQSLEEAIRASKPNLDAKAEVAKARTAARSDLSSIGS